jgi:LysM repeat protein
VQAGDTLVAIAERFGVTPEAIIETSRLADPNSLAVGDTLLIPQPAPATTRPAGAPTPTPTPQQRYVVQAGDTLAAIAERFGVSAAEIARANRLADPDRLKVGDTLVIPASARPAQQPAASGAAAQAARAPTPAPQPPRRRYTVQEGDSLWSIAEANGIGVDALRAANPGLSERLRVGQELVIP